MASRSKVLLVGDRPAPRDELARALQSGGFDVRAASTFELRFAAAGEQPDLVALDVGSLRPEELSDLLGDAAAACPIFLFGDRSDSDLRDLADAARTDAYVAGRSTPQALAAEIARRVQPTQAAAPRPSAPAVDYVAMARRSSRGAFLAVCSFPFLISRGSLMPRGAAARTAGVLDADILRAMEEATRRGPPRRPTGPTARIDTPPKSNLSVFAICRRTPGTDDRITVGREPDVDIQIDHATISKNHAWFLRDARGLKIADAGSRNGTWVAGRLLTPKGSPSPVLESGELVRFGELEFNFLSASAAWDQLRVNTG